VRLQRP